MTKPRITNTAEQSPLEHLAGVAAGGSTYYVEASESHGQSELVNSDQLPTDVRDRHIFEAWGINFGSPLDGDPMTNEPRIAQSWDSIPPVIFDGEEAISTRALEKQHRDCQHELLKITAILNQHGITPDGNDIAAGVQEAIAKYRDTLDEIGWFEDGFMSLRRLTKRQLESIQKAALANGPDVAIEETIATACRCLVATKAGEIATKIPC